MICMPGVCGLLKTIPGASVTFVRRHPITQERAGHRMGASTVPVLAPATHGAASTSKTRGAHDSARLVTTYRVHRTQGPAHTRLVPRAPDAGIRLCCLHRAIPGPGADASRLLDTVRL